jgi:hypothetical protein
VPGRDERADQIVADLTAGAGDEDLHAAGIICRAAMAVKPTGRGPRTRRTAPYSS